MTDKKIDVKQVFFLLSKRRSEIARELGVTTRTVYQMTFDNHIPNHHWQKIIDISQGRITWEMLENLNKGVNHE